MKKQPLAQRKRKNRILIKMGICLLCQKYHTPNADTIEAMNELKSGKGKVITDIRAYLRSL